MLRLAVLAAAIATPAVSAATLPVLRGQVQVVDTQTLAIDSTRVQLAYVHGEAGPLAEQLQRAIAARGGIATCYPFADGRYSCSLADGEDISTLAVSSGLALASADAPQQLKDAQQQAAARGLGGWRVGSGGAVEMPPAIVQPPMPQIVTPQIPDYAAPAPDVVVPAVPDFAAPLPPADDLYAGALLPGNVGYGGASYPLQYGGSALGWGFHDHDHHWRQHDRWFAAHAVLNGPHVVYSSRSAAAATVGTPQLGGTAHFAAPPHAVAVAHAPVHLAGRAGGFVR